MPRGIYERTEYHNKISRKYGFKKGHPKPKNAYSFPKGKDNLNWKDGKKIVNGYILVLKPEHPFCDKQGYIKRSRFVMEQILDRYLKPKEVIHHKGVHFPMSSIENKGDDSPENLKLFKNQSTHMKFHHPKVKNSIHT